MTHETAQRILDAAMDVFAERGFAATTTREIARRAGVPLGSIAYHWGSKDRLWGEVVRVLNDRLVALAQQSACAEEDLATGIGRFLDEVVDALLADPRPIRVMIWAAMQPEGFDQSVVSDAYGPAVRLGIGFLEHQQEIGRLPPSVDVGMALVTFYGLLAEPLLEPAVHRHVFGADPSEPRHAARVRRHLVRSGLALLGLERSGR